MTSPIIVACSHCSSELKLKSASMIGKKVRCPKCQKAFVIEASQETEAEELFDDGGFYDDQDEWEGDIEDLGEELEFGDDFETPTPRKRSGKKSSNKKKKGSKKKRRSKSGVPVAVIAAIAGGGIAFFTLLGVGIYFLLPLLGASADRMLWLPDDTATYFEIRVSSAWKSEVMRPIRTSEMGQSMVAKLKEQTGLEIEDIESIVAGLPTNSRQPTVIFRATKPINTSLLGKTSTYAGRTIYQPDGGREAAFLLDESTLVVAPTSQLHAAIDRQGKTSATEEFSFLPSRADVIFASISPTNAIPSSPVSMMAGSALQTDKLSKVIATLNLSQNLDINFVMGFTDADSAKSALQNAETQLAKQKEQLEAQKKQLENGSFIINRQQKSIVLKTEDVLSTVSFSQSGSDLSTSLKISGSIVEDIVEMFSGAGGSLFPPIGGLGGGMGNPF